MVSVLRCALTSAMHTAFSLHHLCMQSPFKTVLSTLPGGPFFIFRIQLIKKYTLMHQPFNDFSHCRSAGVPTAGCRLSVRVNWRRLPLALDRATQAPGETAVFWFFFVSSSLAVTHGGEDPPDLCDLVPTIPKKARRRETLAPRARLVELKDLS